VRRYWTVYGDVQGVGFRVFVRSAARRLGVTGRVRNLADGSVEVEAQGSVPALAALEQALRTGPPGARVARLEGGAPRADPLPDPFAIG
jgi:acylphosphatase